MPEDASVSPLLEKAKALPRVPGCYIMKDDAGREIYVGKAKDLRARVSSYFLARDRAPKEAALLENVVDFDYVETESEIEAFLLESRLIKDFQPKYNVMLKHGELYPYIEVTLDEDFPRVYVTRQPQPKRHRVFGPFVSSTDVRLCLQALQRIFRFRTCKRRIDAKADRAGRSCLNYQIARCAGPCRNLIDKEEYRRRIHSLCRFLSGQKKDLIEELRREMQAAAGRLEFETAAGLRDLVQALENVNNQPAVDETLVPPPPEYDPVRGLEALREVLGLDFSPRRIEGIDIANLQGRETVGSLVYFLDGQPWKDGYRRFRIKSVAGQDDFACVAEVVRRRYSRLRQEGGELPDLVLIDGGVGQLNAAASALQELGIAVPALLSLAKREEIPYRAGVEGPLPMSRRHAGLKLLMYVRDEAHRFAQHYHHILRRKAMFGEK